MSGTTVAADKRDIDPLGTIGSALDIGGESEDLFANQTPFDSGFPSTKEPSPSDSGKKSDTHMKTGAFVLFADPKMEEEEDFFLLVDCLEIKEMPQWLKENWAPDVGPGSLTVPERSIENIIIVQSTTNRWVRWEGVRFFARVQLGKTVDEIESDMLLLNNTYGMMRRSEEDSGLGKDRDEAYTLMCHGFKERLLVNHSLTCMLKPETARKCGVRMRDMDPSGKRQLLDSTNNVAASESENPEYAMVNPMAVIPPNTRTGNKNDNDNGSSPDAAAQEAPSGTGRRKGTPRKTVPNPTATSQKSSAGSSRSRSRSSKRAASKKDDDEEEEEQSGSDSGSGSGSESSPEESSSENSDTSSSDSEVRKKKRKGKKKGKDKRRSKSQGKKKKKRSPRKSKSTSQKKATSKDDEQVPEEEEEAKETKTTKRKSRARGSPLEAPNVIASLLADDRAREENPDVEQEDLRGKDVSSGESASPSKRLRSGAEDPPQDLPQDPPQDPRPGPSGIKRSKRASPPDQEEKEFELTDRQKKYRQARRDRLHEPENVILFDDQGLNTAKIQKDVKEVQAMLSSMGKLMNEMFTEIKRNGQKISDLVAAQQGIAVDPDMDARGASKLPWKSFLEMEQTMDNESKKYMAFKYLASQDLGVADSNTATKCFHHMFHSSIIKHMRGFNTQATRPDDLPRATWYMGFPTWEVDIGLKELYLKVLKEQGRLVSVKGGLSAKDAGKQWNTAMSNHAKKQMRAHFSSALMAWGNSMLNGGGQDAAVNACALTLFDHHMKTYVIAEAFPLTDEGRPDLQDAITFCKRWLPDVAEEWVKLGRKEGTGSHPMVDPNDIPYTFTPWDLKPIEEHYNVLFAQCGRGVKGMETDYNKCLRNHLKWALNQVNYYLDEKDPSGVMHVMPTYDRKT